MKKKFIDGSTETRETVFCSCGSDEHQIIFVYYDDEPGVVYCHIHLSNYRNFFKRLKYGIMYIFGYKSKYGAFDEIIIEKENLPVFENIIKNIKKLNKKL